MYIRDAIIQLYNLFNKDLVNRIINYINDAELKRMGVGKKVGHVEKDTRNVKGRTLMNDESVKKNMSDFVFLQAINDEIFRALPNYLLKFPNINIEKLIQTDLLKYPVGGKYEVHFDSFLYAPRHLSCIINLNDDYEGGELCFYDGSYKEVILKCDLKKNSMIFFPSNFVYPHKINPITKGHRYSIVSWLA